MEEEAIEDDSGGMAEDQSGTTSQMEADLDSETLPREELSVVKLAFSPLTNLEAKQLLENPPKDKVSTCNSTRLT